MSLTLTLVDCVVREAAYETYQCPGCHACGKALCEMVKGMAVEKAMALGRPTLVERVGPLPRHREICYSLAVLALSDALKKLEA